MGILKAGVGELMVVVVAIVVRVVEVGKEDMVMVVMGVMVLVSVVRPRGMIFPRAVKEARG